MPAAVRSRCLALFMAARHLLPMANRAISPTQAVFYNLPAQHQGELGTRDLHPGMQASCGHEPDTGTGWGRQIQVVSGSSLTDVCDYPAAACPTVVIMDGQSVKTTEVGGTRGFGAFKRMKGRKRHVLVDTLGQPIANRVEAAGISDRRRSPTNAGLKAFFPAITTVIADAGHESKKRASALAE